MIYSRNGNINTRTGMGTYTYGSASKPHAVTAVDNTSGDIDYNSQDVSYNNWNRVSSVWQYYDDDCYGYNIEYGPDLKRVRSQLHTYNNLIYDMFYWDDYEEKTVGTDTLKYYYLYTSGELDALHIIKSGPSGVSTHTTKVITDHLGSITGLADNYYMAYLANFDAWGGRDVYIPYWFDGTFNRGYTGHEHIDELGLINMNSAMSGGIFSLLSAGYIIPQLRNIGHKNMWIEKDASARGIYHLKNKLTQDEIDSFDDNKPQEFYEYRMLHNMFIPFSILFGIFNIVNPN